MNEEIGERFRGEGVGVLYFGGMVGTTISAFRKAVKKHLDRVIDGGETLVVRRGKDEGVVFMSLKDFKSLSAMHHELASKVNEERLDEAIRELGGGEGAGTD